MILLLNIKSFGRINCTNISKHIWPLLPSRSNMLELLLRPRAKVLVRHMHVGFLKLCIPQVQFADRVRTGRDYKTARGALLSSGGLHSLKAATQAQGAPQYTLSSNQYASRTTWEVM